MRDLFGLQRERLIQQSKIRDVFTPHRPVDSIDFFKGREEQIKKIISALGTPGEHAVLFGERGVGKSSLANVASFLHSRYLREALPLVFYRCDRNSSFTSISENFLEALGIEFTSSTVSVEKDEGGEAGVKIPIAHGKLSSKTKKTTTRERPARMLTPSAVAQLVGTSHALLVVDEFDALQSVDDRYQVAELIKQLSDRNSGAKLLVVGIGDSCADLLEGHGSAGRSLREIELGRMSARELRQIVEDGAKKTRIRFTESLIEEIVSLSAGYPYFTHLLALQCAEIAVVSGAKACGLDDLPAAAAAAVDAAEERLRHTYNAAVRSNSSSLYQAIIEAAAGLPLHEFTAQQLRESIGAQLGRQVSQSELTNPFRRLVNDDGSRMLRRVAKGIYRFSDPRMKSFVLIGRQRRTWNSSS